MHVLLNFILSICHFDLYDNHPIEMIFIYIRNSSTSLWESSFLSNENNSPFVYYMVYKLNKKKKRKQNTNAKKNKKKRKIRSIYFPLFCFVCVYHTGTRERALKIGKRMNLFNTHPHTHTNTHTRKSIDKNRKRQSVVARK